MSTPNWSLFVAVVVIVTVALLVMARASARFISAEADPDRGGDRSDPARWEGSHESPPEPGSRSTPGRVPTGSALLANVVVTHGGLGAGLLVLMWYTSIPVDALGARDVSPQAVAAGFGLGVGLYLASEAGGMVANHAGVEYDERLRELMAPERPIEWILLLFVVLPTIAGAEELLFRGILIGVLSSGLGLPVWALVVVSSVLFGLGHTAQGTVGIVVTAVLGAVLATAFVLSGSLVVVIVAHYTVDALEFVIREGVLE